MQLKIDEILKQNKEKEISLTTELDSSQEQLRSAVVTSKIIEAISKEKGNVDLLMPHVKSHVQMIKNSQGQFVPEVINAEGGPRVNSSGKDMTIVEFVQEMKVNDTFAAAFPGANSTGSGKQNSNSAPPKKNDEKVIKAGDAKGLSQNLEEIATGKVNVDMTMSD